MERAIFGAGCFWGVEHAFSQVPGVVDTRVGYSGGHTDNPTYPQVCSGGTGHAEVVEVTYDSKQISYERLLEAFFDCHDPTQKNRQGPDVGTQYRSVVFHLDEGQARAAREKVSALEDSGRFLRPIATEIAPAGRFWPAEEYHQQYFKKNGVGVCHI